MGWDGLLVMVVSDDQAVWIRKYVSFVSAQGCGSMRGTKKGTQPCRRIGDLTVTHTHTHTRARPAGDAFSVESDFDGYEARRM